MVAVKFTSQRYTSITVGITFLFPSLSLFFSLYCSPLVPYCSLPFYPTVFSPFYPTVLPPSTLLSSPLLPYCPPPFYPTDVSPSTLLSSSFYPTVLSPLSERSSLESSKG